MKTSKQPVRAEVQDQDLVVLGAANVATKGPAGGKEPVGDGGMGGVRGISDE
ncbi:TPA: hypothetical protein UOJ00_002965 [Stenotrophomonas maltophilia]|nr:hypothetical protein [Stenotrophomonas maltophilia]